VRTWLKVELNGWIEEDTHTTRHTNTRRGKSISHRQHGSTENVGRGRRGKDSEIVKRKGGTCSRSGSVLCTILFLRLTLRVLTARHTCIHTHTHTHTHIHTLTHTYTYTHTYVHTYNNVRYVLHRTAEPLSFEIANHIESRTEQCNKIPDAQVVFSRDFWVTITYHTHTQTLFLCLSEADAQHPVTHHYLTCMSCIYCIPRGSW